MEFTAIIGLLAGAMTTLSFIPQVIKVVRTKSTKDISLAMFVIFTTGVLFWIAYGFLLNEPPLIIANAVVFVLAAVILGYKLRFK